jgi:hypothetical protein
MYFNVLVNLKHNERSQKYGENTICRANRQNIKVSLERNNASKADTIDGHSCMGNNAIEPA